MRILIFVLLLPFLLYRQELLVIDTTSYRLIFNAVPSALYDISWKLRIGIVAVQTTSRRAATETE